ncbi:efflux transporter outer membrane subunit [Ponticaulis profundi]|uniref:Efflux transporter outer membrane subunit n=1 Tax=Ponticaulis profundi TaxID=2665222 RepID=A0ABW1SEL3_9PROT
MKTKLFVTLSLFAALAGCAVVPEPEERATLIMDLPDTYDYAEDLASIETQDADWWSLFNDQTLNELQEQALAANPSIEIGLANLRAARANLASSRASLFPQVSGSASASSDTENGLDDISASGRLSASYELDVFGTNRLNIEASELSLQSAEYDQRAVELAIKSDVAANYFNLLAARYQLDVAKRSLEISERIYGIVEARYQAGDVSGFDMASQQTSLATTRARIPQLENQISGFEAALATLTGVAPQGFSVADTNLMSVAAPGIEAGLPSSLLTQRPDLLSSEAGLRSAQLDVEIARKSFLPSFDLGAGISSVLLDGFDPIGSLSSSVTLPIFTGGQLQSQLEGARARADSAMASYRQSILSALQEVDTGLSALKANEERAPHLVTAEASAARALEIAEIRYRAGADDLTSLLNAQQSYDSASADVVDNYRERLIAAVNLYVALGGGWQESTSPLASISENLD